MPYIQSTLPLVPLFGSLRVFDENLQGPIAKMLRVIQPRLPVLFDKQPSFHGHPTRHVTFWRCSAYQRLYDLN